MSRFSVKSILLGIGIGIVFMSIISMIYLAGMDPEKDLSEDEILKIAEKYDLVKRSDVINGDMTSTDNTSVTEATTAATTTAATTAATATKATSSAATTATTGATSATTGNNDGKNEQIMVLTISSGDTSEKIAARLHLAGIIENEAEFVKLIGSMGKANKIQVGDYKISKNASMKEIIDIITK